MGSQPRGISASRGASVLGLNDWQPQFEVWQLIMEERKPGFNASRGLALPPPPDNAAIRWGTAFEDSVVELAERTYPKYGKIEDREMFWSHDFILDNIGFLDAISFSDSHPITCHIDGRYTFDILHEGKTTTSWTFREKWGEPGTDQIPKNYQIQTQHQMLCTGAEEDIVSVLVFPDSPDNWEKMGWQAVGREDGKFTLFREPAEVATPSWWARTLAEMGFFHQFPVKASRDLHKLMVEGYSDFWHRNVLEEKEPDITRYADILRAFPEPTGVLVVDEKLESWLRELAEVKEEISASGRLGKRVDELKTLILADARKQTTVPDEGAEKKLIFKSATGKKLGQYDGKTFRT